MGKKYFDNMPDVDKAALKYSLGITNKYTESELAYSVIFNDYYQNSSGALVSAVNWVVKEYGNINSTYTYKATGRVLSAAMAMVAYLDASNNVISVQIIGEGSSGINYTDYQLTVPSTAKKIRINGDVATGIIKLKVTTPDNLNNTGLAGKKALSLGDSMTSPNKYQSTVLSETGLLQYASVAKGGRHLKYFNRENKLPLANESDETLLSSAFLQQFDVITILGAANNFGSGITIGSLGDTLASNTFYGECDYLITDLLTKHPTATMLWISCPQVESEDLASTTYPAWGNPAPNNPADPTNTGNDPNRYYQSEYDEAMQKVCEKYGVPFLSLYKNSGITDLTFANYSASASDHVHLNDAGNVRIGKIIANTLLSIQK